MLVMLALADVVLRLEGLDAKDPRAGVAVLEDDSCSGCPFQFVMLTLGGAIRGLGDTIRPFYVTLGSCFIHGLFNWLLIFGNLGFPKLGLTGGAVAMLAESARGNPALRLLSCRRPRSATSETEAGSSMSTGRRDCFGSDFPPPGQQILRVGSMTLVPNPYRALRRRQPGDRRAQHRPAERVAGVHARLRLLHGGSGVRRAEPRGEATGAGQAGRVAGDLAGRRRDEPDGSWCFFVLAEPFARLFVRTGRP